MAKFVDHDAYIAGAAELHRPTLMRLRGLMAVSLPGAVEIIKYDMPGFALGETIVASYAAFSKQCGLYLSKGAVASFADEIAAAGLKASKMGITFGPKNPVPDDLVCKLVLASRRDLGL